MSGNQKFACIITIIIGTVVVLLSFIISDGIVEYNTRYINAGYEQIPRAGDTGYDWVKAGSVE